MGKHKNYNIEKIKKYWETTSLTINQISKETSISSDMVRYYIKKLNMIRPNHLKEQELSQTIERRRTNRLKNNNGTYFSESSIDKMKQTRYDRNNGNYFSKQSIDKIKQTNLEKYGVENVFQLYEVKEKSKQTKQLKYNSEYYNNSDKAKATRITKNGQYVSKNQIEQMKQTNLKKYGVEYYTQTDIYKTKSKLTRYAKNNGNYFGEDTKEQLRKIAKLNYKKSNNLRIKAIKNNYGNFQNTYYINNDKMMKILKQPEKNLQEYIMQLDISDRNFAYIQQDLNISYTTLLNLLHQYNLKDLLTNTRSHFQQEIINLIKHYNISYIENCRTVIPPQELDIFIPDYNLAIECNGNYWHASINKTDKNYHYNKSKLCEQKGIRLIHIFEYEWYNERQQPILINIIKNALHINDYKLYARKLDIEIRKSASMKDFFNTNNIQGFRGGKFAICLVDKVTREPYMAYIMGHAYFGKGKYEWEVIRGATKLGYTIVGGASKIFNYFIKQYNPNNCVYYIDYNYFNGNSLKNMPNMEFIKTQISYKNYWVNFNIVKNREPMKNAEIKELYRTGKVLQIYNAGTKVYVWQKPTS